MKSRLTRCAWSWLIRVIDGVAVDVDFDLSRREDPDRIRMIGIDTPETTYSYGNHPECYGEEARRPIACW